MSYGIELSFAIDSEEDEIGKILEETFIEEDGKILIDDNRLDELSETEYKKLQQYMGERSNIKMKIDFTKGLNFSNDFEHYEHGIMSAYLLMKTIYSFNTFNFRYNDYRNILQDYVDIARFISIQEILNAISNHTCSKFQIKGIGSTSEFLVFIDELEEFSRISRTNQNRQYVEEFCKTDLSFLDGWFLIDFIFDNENIEALNPEFAFKGIYQKLSTLFDIHNLDTDLKIRLRCIDELFGKHDIYCLEIARKYANIIINDEEQNIPEYLGCRSFYTKEEYQML